MRNTLEPNIRRLLRRREGSEYYKAGGWTRNAGEAEGFSDILEAATACSKHRLKNVELVLRMGTGVCDIFCTGMPSGTKARGIVRRHHD